MQIQPLPTEKTATDYLHSAVKIAAGMIPIPYADGVVAEIFESVFTAPLERRKEEWLQQMGSAINELYKKVNGLSPDDLSKNDEFISACLQASNIALRSHQKEKLEALRAAIKNTVLMKDMDYIKKSMFIRLIDEFSPLHLRIMDMYVRPDWYQQQLRTKNPNTQTLYRNLATIWDAYYPDIKSTDAILNLAERDILIRGLSYFESMQTPNISGQLLSPLGKEFFEFIRDES